MVEDTSSENLRKKLNRLREEFREAEDQEQRRETVSKIVDIGGSKAVDLLLNELVYYEEYTDRHGYCSGDEYWFSEAIIEGLGKIGNEKALDVLNEAFEYECDYVRQFHIEHNPNSDLGPAYKDGIRGFLCYDAAAAIANIGGNKAKKMLLSHVMDHDPWWSSFVAVKYLESLKWKPENDEEKIACIIAKHNWNECKEMGDIAMRKAIGPIVEATYYFVEDVTFSSEIAEAINSFGKEKVISIIEEEGFGKTEFGSTEETIGCLEEMIKNYE